MYRSDTFEMKFERRAGKKVCLAHIELEPGDDNGFTVVNETEKTKLYLPKEEILKMLVSLWENRNKE